MVFSIETVGIRKVAKWVFELRTKFATSFKFHNVFARQSWFVKQVCTGFSNFTRQSWFAKFLQPLRNFHKVHLGFVKFSQGEFGVVKFSQGEFGVVKLSHALVNCFVFRPSEKIGKVFSSILESTCN